MKLPNAYLAVVEREKVVDYLLNPVHRYGASKAQFFAEFGFQIEAWEVLAAALREHGQRHEVGKVKETGFGPRYEVDGRLVMIKEHDYVVLTQDLPEEKMEAGDVGTVIHIHQGGAGYEVEFMTLAGETVAVITLLPTQVRPIAQRDIGHVREPQTV